MRAEMAPTGCQNDQFPCASIKKKKRGGLGGGKKARARKKLKRKDVIKKGNK